MTPERARQAISLVDLTNLADDCDEDAVEALCARALQFRTAAVCVWPDFVRLSAELLSDGGVEIATVVNFPTGDERPYSVTLQTDDALAAGATEIDVVLPYRRFVAGDIERTTAVLRSVRRATQDRARLKVILETGQLPDLETVRRAADVAIEHGADFVKTSTGKSPVSATPAAVSIMMDAIGRAGRPVGIKPSGGIGTAADAEVYLQLAAEAMGDDWIAPSTFRFGASSLLTALLSAAGIDDQPSTPPSGY